MVPVRWCAARWKVPVVTLVVFTLAVSPALAQDQVPSTSVAFPSLPSLEWEATDLALPPLEDGRVFAQVPPIDGADAADATPGFLVAGSFHDPAAGHMERALAWTSTDALDWTRVELSAPPGSYPSTAAVQGDEVLLVGTAYDVRALKRGGYRPTAVVWRRAPDGVWGRLDEVPADALVWGTGTVPEGIVALGRSVPKKGKASPSLMGAMLRPAIWVSADGRAWERTLLETEPMSTGANAVPGRMAVAPDGIRLIAGTDVATGDVLLWRSIDGVEWVPVSPPAKGRGASFRSLVATPTGFALLLLDGPDRTRSTIWASADGSAWETVYQAAGPLILHRVGDGFMGFGTDRVVASVDGYHWQEAETTAFAGVTVIGAAQLPDGSVVAGAVGGPSAVRVLIGTATGL